MRHRSARSGVTLLELIVVLALLGLVFTIAAPSFLVPNTAHEPELGHATDAARRAALLRGEAVTLSLARDGSWRVDSDASSTAKAIVMGSFRGPTTPLRLRVSPLGSCLPESVDGAAVPAWNATTCAPAPPNQTSAR